jgi:predicted dehydrogenase
MRRKGVVSRAWFLLPLVGEEGESVVKLAIIGCGAVVEGLYQGPLGWLTRQREARVVALVDPNPARTAALQRHFRGARAFMTPADAFAHTQVDLTIVASPPGRHAEHAVLAFEHGSHVLCEKPLAGTLADGERMVAAAGRARRILAVGMTRRFFPCLAEARRLIGSGALGRPLRFVYREGDVYGWPASTDAAFRRATAGGGVLSDLGSHVLDSLAALFGPPEVTANEDDALRDGVETNCRLTLAFPGATGVVQLSWSQPLVTGLHVMGPDGELKLDPGRLDRLSWRRPGRRWEARVSDARWPGDLALPPRRRGTPRTYYDCIFYQLVQVMRAAVHGEPVPVGGEEGLWVMRAIDEGYRRARPLTLPWLTDAEQAHAAAAHWSETCAAV